MYNQDFILFTVVQNSLLKLSNTLASKCSSVTRDRRGVRISPAQLKSLSTLALLGRVVFILMKSSLILGNSNRDSTEVEALVKYMLVSGAFSTSSNTKKSSSSGCFVSTGEGGWDFSSSVTNVALAVPLSWVSPVHLSLNLKHTSTIMLVYVNKDKDLISDSSLWY